MTPRRLILQVPRTLPCRTPATILGGCNNASCPAVGVLLVAGCFSQQLYYFSYSFSAHMSAFQQAVVKTGHSTVLYPEEACRTCPRFPDACHGHLNAVCIGLPYVNVSKSTWFLYQPAWLPDFIHLKTDSKLHRHGALCTAQDDFQGHAY